MNWKLGYAKGWEERMVLVLSILGCSDSLTEGVNPGECTDGEDNDADGYFDCEDHDCTGAPDCADGLEDPGPAVDDTDEPDVEDTDAEDTGIGDPPGDLAWSDMALQYVQTLDFAGAFEDTYCASYGLCDCTSTFAADGTAVESTPDRVTFIGTWRVAETDCNEMLVDAVWIPDTGGAFHSLHFLENGAVLDAWVAHGDEQDVAPNTDSQEQWFIYDMGAPLATQRVEHTESMVDNSDPFVEIRVDHSVTVDLVAR